MFDPPETKKAMDYSSIAFFVSILMPATRQIKKAMGAWKPPMAFAFKSNNHSSTGQASFMSAQHHQLPCLILKKIFT